MFNFMNMMGNYNERKVDHYEYLDLIVDTAQVTDSDKPYETAVQHPRYNKGKWVIVEMYDTKEQAQEGHSEWVKKMSQPNLPETLKDVSTAGIASLLDIFDEGWRDR